MKTKTLISLAITAILVFSSNAFAIIYTFNDTGSTQWRDWPYIPSNNHTQIDQLGTPSANRMLVSIENKTLKQVDIVFTADDRQLYDSLFINTSYSPMTQNGSWDDWDYFVRDGFGSGHDGNTTGVGDEANDGFYQVNSESSYSYTFTLDGNGSDVRENNPNGIDEKDLTLLDISYPYSVSDSLIKKDDGWYLTYTFGDGISLKDGFFIAYAPWCANDVLGGGAPVPEPTTMLLFGTGIAGLAGMARRRRQD